MERIAVRSQDIAVVGYDSLSETLELAFRSGNVYHYQKVPEKVYSDLLKAPSKGLYVRDHVKEKYDYQKVC